MKGNECHAYAICAFFDGWSCVFVKYIVASQGGVVSSKIAIQEADKTTPPLSLLKGGLFLTTKL